MLNNVTCSIICADFNNTLHTKQRGLPNYSPQLAIDGYGTMTQVTGKGTIMVQ